MQFDNPIHTVLTQPDNLDIAFEVMSHLQKIQEEAHKAFWLALEEALQRRLVGSLYETIWLVKFEPIGGFEKAWFACGLFPRDEFVPQGTAVGQILLQQSPPTQDFRLATGIKASVDLPKQPGESEIIGDLCRALNAEGFGTNDKWFGVRYIDYRARGKAFVRRMANDEEAFIDECADLIWQLFLTHRERLEAFLVNID